MTSLGLQLGLSAQRPLYKFVGALDNYAPTMVWSHRRALLTSFTGHLLQARRTSDDAPYDVAKLANGEGDEAGLLSFAGSSSAAVASLTEQMGTGVNFAQSTADSQRIIIDSGSLVTVGGKTASKGRRTGSNGVIGGSLVAPVTIGGTTLSVFIRGRADTPTGIFNGGIVAPIFVAAKNDTITSVGQFAVWLTGDSGVSKLSLVGNDAYMVNAQPHVADFLISIIFDGTTVTYRDGTNTYTYSASATFDVNKLLIGSLTESGQDNTAEHVKIQEVAVWTTNQTANEAAIRSAMMA